MAQLNGIEINSDDIKRAIKAIGDGIVPPPKANWAKSDYLIEGGKDYPAKYVVALARHWVINKTIEGKVDVEGFNSNDAMNVLKELGFATEKRGKDMNQTESGNEMEKYSSSLINSKNIILHGAPGTGKSYLAKQIAAYIISNKQTDNYSNLTEDQKQQVEFVQFHPGYDYTDFVEGLRPVIDDKGTMSFKLMPGVFKTFVDRAKTNYEVATGVKCENADIDSIKNAMNQFFSEIEFGRQEFRTDRRGSRFTINSISDDNKYVEINVPDNKTCNNVRVKISEIRDMLESDEDITLKDIHKKFERKFQRQEDSYALFLYNEIKKLIDKKPHDKSQKTEEKKYVFIIDEINRGEISKIFGELFYSIDPGYRGKSGEIKTQYSNLHKKSDEKFYIPDNVYIIGTMNDIDRSVDSFDFAMRRRFRFIEITAKDSKRMLSLIGSESMKSEAEGKMDAINKLIYEASELGSNYQIGAAYFLKLREEGMTTDKLWEDYLEPLLREYVRGLGDESVLMNNLKNEYGYNPGSTDR